MDKKTDSNRYYNTAEDTKEDMRNPRDIKNIKGIKDIESKSNTRKKKSTGNAEAKKKDRVYIYKENSRRDFIKKVGLGLGAVALGGVGTLIPKKAKAEITMKDLPPGIASCRDKMVKWAYLIWENQWDGTDVDYKARVASILRIDDVQYQDDIVDINTPLIEPAYWFMCAKTKMYPFNVGRYSDKNLKKNISLYNFSYGLGDYFMIWIENKAPSSDANIVEEDLLKSIITAANRPESETKEYLKMNLDQKEKYLKELMHTFNSMKIDKNARLINDNYDKAMIAQWAAFIYTFNEINLSNKEFDEKYKEAHMVNEIFEVPLRNLTPKVRGPPSYNI